MVIIELFALKELGEVTKYKISNPIFLSVVNITHFRKCVIFLVISDYTTIFFVGRILL